MDSSGEEIELKKYAEGWYTMFGQHHGEEIREKKMSDENWFVLYTDDVERKLKILTQKGIPCMSIPKINSNISFPASYVDQVLPYIDGGGESYSLDPTNMPGVFIMKFYHVDGIASRSSIDKCEIPSNMEGWDYLNPVVKAAYDIFGTKMVLTNSHGKFSPPIDSNGDILYVRFWSTPVETTERSYKKVFGVRLEKNQRDGLEPSKIGYRIVDDSGETVAEYLNDNLYILFDLPHARGEMVTEVFAKIMQSFFVYKGKAQHELIRFYHAVMGRKLSDAESSKEQFIKACSKLYEKNVEMMESNIRAYDSRITESSQQLVRDLREREILSLKVEPLKSSVEAKKKWADKQYDDLCQIPHVKNVTVDGVIIHVFTDLITINFEDKDYNIGEFRIDIYTDGRSGGVAAFNLTKPYKSLAHPHVKVDGSCCLGNISSGVTKLLADYEYVILAQLMITFLQSYNPESPYGRVTLWG